MSRKRINITVDKEPYEALRALTKKLGWRDNWLSLEIDKLVAGLLVVAAQAAKDAEEQVEMTEEEAKKRYESLMRQILESKK